MSIIIIILLLTATPLMLGSYHNYTQSQQSLQYLGHLQALANICNKISKERGPGNVAMTDFSADKTVSAKKLYEFRKSLDADIQLAIAQFQAQGYQGFAAKLQHDVIPALQQGRAQVDAFIALPLHQKNPVVMDKAVVSMFDAWNISHVVLKEFLYRYHGQNQEITDTYTLTFLLTELRDQAGRLGSNIIPSMAFGQRLSPVHMDRISRNQKNIQLLWQMVDEIESDYAKDARYQQLRDKVTSLYLQEGLAFVRDVLSRSQQQPDFVLDSGAFTRQYVERMTTVVNLQDYVFDYSNVLVNRHKERAFWVFLTTMLSSLTAILIVLSMMYYFNRRVFSPLLMARDMLLDVSESREYAQPAIRLHKNNEFNALFEAIHQVQQMMHKRELLASELSQIANTDSLTGLRNRMALQKQIEYLESQPDRLNHTALMVMDIDNFKTINDQYGHLIGDLAIVFIAQKIKENIRAEDFAARYGGDELIILLDKTSLGEAVDMANRIQHSVASDQFMFAEAETPILLSISIGVASSADNWQVLMERADRCLLKAKSLGKNRVAFEG